MSAAAAWSHDESWNILSLSELADGDLDAYLQRVAESAAAQFEATGASIFLKDEEPGLFRLRARAGRQSTVPKTALIVQGKGLAGRVVSAGRARILGDLSKDSAFTDIAPKDRSSVSSSLVVPLLEPNGQALGVLNLSRHKGIGPFVEQDLERAKAVAAVVSLAVSNARLLDSLTRQMNELQATTEKLQAVFDSVGSALIVLDERGVVVEYNEPALAYLSPDPDAWLGSEAFAPAFQKAVRTIRETAGSESVRVFDVQVGKSWLLHGTHLKSGGVVLAVMDLTEHEHALRETERLRRLAEIGQMTAAVAHEIRNPLTGIRSAAQMVRDDPSLADEFLGMIEEEVLKLNTLCEEFLAFSKPLVLDWQDADLAALVKGVCDRCRPEFDEDGVSLALEAEPELPTIKLDKRRVEQVVLNLLRNARQACKLGGKVEVAVSAGRFTVKDDGQGMSPAQTERLFSPFYTTKADGTGLGLCNVRRILDEHGAKVKVQSKPGLGSTFYVEFDRSKS